MWYTQVSSKLRLEYARTPWRKALRCDRLYDEYVLERILKKCLSESICDNMPFYLRLKKNGTVHDSADHATSLTMLQQGSCNTEASFHWDRTDSRRGNTEHREGNNDNISSDSLSPIRFSHKNAPFPRSYTARPLSWFGNSNNDAARNRSGPYHEWCQSTMRHSAASVWQAATQRHNVQPLHPSSGQRSSICAVRQWLCLTGYTSYV